MSNDTPHGPYQGDGETVYASDPDDQGGITTRSGDEYDEVWHDPEWLHMQYHVMGKSQREVAETCDVSRRTIIHWMEKHDIPTRDHSKAVSLCQGGNPKLWDEDWVRTQYLQKERQIVDIAEDLDVSREAVRGALHRFGIETRTQSEVAEKLQERLHGDKKYNNESWLRHQYAKLGKSPNEIAEENGWSARTVERALDRHGVRKRSRKAANLNRYKKEKCRPEKSNRELVSESGIDASWRDIQDRDQSCYLPYRDPGWLREQLKLGKSDREIAESCNVECSESTISYWLRRLGIERDEE